MFEIASPVGKNRWILTVSLGSTLQVEDCTLFAVYTVLLSEFHSYVTKLSEQRFISYDLVMRKKTE